MNLDVLTCCWDEIGLATTHAAKDPIPSVRVENGIVVEMDGKSREEFDSIDLFIADHGIDVGICEQAMRIPSMEFAKMLVDIHVSREELVRLAQGMTPAKLTEVIAAMNIVEIMMAQMKMRGREFPANQAHITNHKDNPVLMAADAAEAALRGFYELETTCIVGRYAPMNSLAVLVGSQAGRAGVLTQCAMEEAVELNLGMLGLTSYAETISFYGTEQVFTDGDDTPWSKAFLAAAYASRGMKMRASSGSGSEALMGQSESKSMLYLEIRCIWLIKASGIQGIQNGSIDAIGLSSSLPGGLKMVAGENMVVSLLGMEVASGNDSWFTSSDMRRAAKYLVSLFPGTDFITSGYSGTPNEDNSFGGSNMDTDDYDDYCMIQRDYLADGALTPVEEQAVIAVRRRGAQALQAVFESLDFAPITDEEIEAAVYAYSSKDIIDRDPQSDMKCAQRILEERISGIDIARILKEAGFEKESAGIFEMVRQRIAGDYLQTSAVFDRDFSVCSALNCANHYSGPGTGYRMGEERQAQISNMRTQMSAEDILRDSTSDLGEEDMEVTEVGRAGQGTVKNEVVVIVSPTFGDRQKKTLSQVTHLSVLNEILAGLEEEGVHARFVKCYESSDLGYIASMGSKMSGSGISIGIQSKGTAVIHQRDLPPLSNLELFSQAPLIDRDTYREIGKSAGKYAKEDVPTPIRARVDPTARRYFVKAMLLHHDDTACVDQAKGCVEFHYRKKVQGS